MPENTGTATAEVIVDKLPDDKGIVTSPDTDSEDVTYQTDVDEAKKEWEEKKVGPPPGSARWNKMYYQGKESERLSTELSEVKKTVSNLRQHNEELMKAVTDTKDTITASVALSQKTSEDNTKTEIAKLRQQRRTAAAEGNMELAYEIEDKLDELKESISKSDSKVDADDIAKKVENNVRAVEDKKTYSKFLKENQWYDQKHENFDEAMTAYADVLWIKANKNWSGTYEENLIDIKSKVEAKFGISGNGKAKTTGGSGLPPVQGAGGGLPPKDTKIELTDEEQRVAVNMFSDMSPSEAIKRYSNQKVIIAKARGAR